MGEVKIPLHGILGGSIAVGKNAPAGRIKNEIEAGFGMTLGISGDLEHRGVGDALRSLGDAN
jgi:hypothetical protein